MRPAMQEAEAEDHQKCKPSLSDLVKPYLKKQKRAGDITQWQRSPVLDLQYQNNNQNKEKYIMSFSENIQTTTLSRAWWHCLNHKFMPSVGNLMNYRDPFSKQKLLSKVEEEALGRSFSVWTLNSILSIQGEKKTNLPAFPFSVLPSAPQWWLWHHLELAQLSWLWGWTQDLAIRSVMSPRKARSSHNPRRTLVKETSQRTLVKACPPEQQHPPPPRARGATWRAGTGCGSKLKQDRL